MGEPPVPPPLPGPIVLLDLPGRRVRQLICGWIAVRPAHAAWAGPSAAALPAIAMARSWSGWLPITSVLIEHTDSTILVDTGEVADRPPGHFACGSGSQESVYRRAFRLAVEETAEVPTQLCDLGVDPRGVHDIVLTHLHADHTGTVGAFPNATIHLGAAELPGYPGATSCRLPTGQRLHPIAGPLPFNGAHPLPAAHALTADRAVEVLALPGHTPGHLGLRIRSDDGTALVLTGDLALTTAQLSGRRLPGITTDRAAARRSLAAIHASAEAGTKTDVVMAHQTGVIDPAIWR